MPIKINTEENYRYSNFRNQNLAGTDWKGVDLTGSNFVDCILSGSKFHGCNLQYCNFTRCNMNGAKYDSETKTGGSAWLQRIPKEDKGKGATNIHPSIKDADDTLPPEEELEGYVSLTQEEEDAYYDSLLH